MGAVTLLGHPVESQAPPKISVRVQDLGRSLFGGSKEPQSCTCRKEETPVVALRGPLSGGASFPLLLLPLFCACGWGLPRVGWWVRVLAPPPPSPSRPPAETTFLSDKTSPGTGSPFASAPAFLAAGLPLAVGRWSLQEPWGGANMNPNDGYRASGSVELFRAGEQEEVAGKHLGWAFQTPPALCTLGQQA